MRSSFITFYLDTTSSCLIAGIVKDDVLIDKIEENMGKDLSTNTLFLIDDMFSKNNIDVNDINKIVVVNGPGSFTGIRIGITIAKTYAWALDKRITVISSLEAMSVSTNIDEYKIPYIDARRGYVYAGIYDKNNRVIIDNCYIKFADLVDKIMGMNKPYKLISNDNLTSDTVRYNVDILNIVRYANSLEEINPHSVNPIYLKKTEAEESKGINAE